ncbi:MAG TPA: type 4a pilus biogenesis protein PilO [Vicinamibacterales bacterium]|nr:type 4a pilus biogenesis protein PilO [Vicinamibacterales bacterium]
MANLSIAKMPWYGQLGVFLLISVGLAGAFYYFVDSKKQIELDTKTRELSDIRGRISKGQAMARQLPEFKKEIGTLEARLDSLKPILPDERDVGDLLRRVQTLATQSSLQVRGFKPQAITTKEMHAEWPIALQLEGNYHNLGLFLDRVSKFPRIINIGNMMIAAKDEPTVASSLTISATATTFVLVDTPPPAPEEPAKKGKSSKKVPAKIPAKK